MGDNLKYLATVKSRFWNNGNPKLSPSSQGDDFISMTWEGTDNQPGDGPAELSCFSGGPAAVKAHAIARADRDKVYGDMLEKMYPGFKDNFVTSRWMSWPDEQWTLAGYSFPAPGQVTTVGPLLAKGVGRLHFAGEHTCYKFVGYMEGALSSGAAVAMKLAKRDGVLMKEPTTTPAASPAAAG
jgi:monoamine oxidase